jgi:DNA-binding transcriptional ArsR family regulator
MGATHPATLANEEFDLLLRKLRDVDVSIADLARAANVTHRAISRRLSK